MARRKRIELHNNHERWMVSYADFVTLLFAFFVVMYSISTVNEDKYRVLSSAMGTAFRQPDAGEPPVPLTRWAQIPVLMNSPLDSPAVDAAPLTIPLRPPPPADTVAQTEPLDEDFSARMLDAAEEEVNVISDDVEQRMQESIDEEMIDVTRNKFWLEVEIKSSLLFESGSSELIPASVPLLAELSRAFVDLPNRIHIEGFTDDEPINTPVFPSNWELSSARAAAVVRLFERNGIESSRLATIGYGEYQPVVKNITEEDRARNRRVVVVVLASLASRNNDRIHEFELLKEKSLAQATN
ncbi:MAG: flagellar motor protein MotD [Gammaproteobacteria bacterium]|jgi:chemotaxis protein MotB|nr:flagellar motor protein MotD [Gammaproteobacteria bacterium]